MAFMELLEEVARGVLVEAGMGDGAVDAYKLAKWARCTVRIGRPGMRPLLLGRTIIVAPEDPPERQRFATAHELSHLLLRERSIRDTEWRTNWLASALLHPREWFLERLASRGWDLAGLKIDCPFSSYEAIGRRVVNLDRAVLWVCDRAPSGRSSYRVCSQGLKQRLARPTSIEWTAVKEAARTLEPVQTAALGAWPLPKAERLRVLSLARADALAI